MTGVDLTRSWVTVRPYLSVCVDDSDDPHADYWRFRCELQEEERLISAAAARNCRRRARRNANHSACYHCMVGNDDHGLGHGVRSRMNPNRTVWGKR